jgi:hypothetical protein
MDHSGWVNELDLSVTDNHLRMGTRALAPEHWLLRDQAAPSELALRRRLMDEQRDQVFACNAPAEPAATEAAELVGHWLGDHGLELWPEKDALHPLARAGLSVQEDLCLMVHHHGAWHLEAALLCFPSTWSLTEKLGRPAAEVHAPVAHYADELSARVDTFFDRMAPGKLATRRNLSVWPTCLLWVPTADIEASLWDPPSVDPSVPWLWIRSERQTLRRLPGTGAILFTIRVQCAPLSVLSGSPRRATDLAAWLRGPGGESRRHQLGSLLDHDLAWLDQVGQANATRN